MSYDSSDNDSSDDDLLDSETSDSDSADSDITDSDSDDSDSDDNDLAVELVALVSHVNYRPLKPRQLAKKLHVPDHRVPDLRRLIKRLARQGKLSYGDRHRVGPAMPVAGAHATSAKRPASGRITGVFRRALGGFGFVRPGGSSPGADRSHDIYVAATDSADASTGDVVLVRLLKSRGKFGQPQGAVQEVIERETHQFVGTYFESGGAAFVQVDGTLFTRAVAVGDPGAKNAQPDDKVVFEMVRFPTHIHDGEGVITEVLGPSGKPGVDTLSILREFNLNEEFAPDVLAAARLEADGFDESIPSERLDLTSETVVTIDPVDARDFDDAISLKRIENGHWQLGVHIADVSHFVRPGTPLDRDAHERATSVYLPDRVIPMLPEIISNGLASLQPGRVRYTITAVLEFTGAGMSVAADVHVSAIKSDHRFSYEEIDDYLADPDGWRTRLSGPVHALVAQMHDLAMILRRRRLARGALELSLPEIKIDLDRQGRMIGAHRQENTESHQVIEEFMLAANEAVARLLADAEIPFLRRVHGAPDERKVKALAQFVRALGCDCDNLQDRFELQRLLNDVTGTVHQQAVHFAALRSLQRAVYSPEEEGHFALASDCYCHFTSPIRRYPDLTVHRLLRSLASHRKSAGSSGNLAALGEHCSEREQRAQSAERELTRVKLLTYLSGQVGLELDAIVTGVESFGLFAQGTEVPADGLIHITSLVDDYYDFDRGTYSLTGRRAGNRFRLGDLVRVVVARVDVDRRELDFRLVARRAAPRPSRNVDAKVSVKKAKGRPKRGKKSSDAAHGKGTGKGRPPKKARRRKA